jgi:hypothetical protein
MEMPTASRSALIRRISAVLGADRPVPKQWAELSVTEQLILQGADPQAAQILKGEVPADLELQVISGKLADTAPAVVTEAQLQRQAIDEWCAAHPAVDDDERQRQLNQRIADRQEAAEASLQESIQRANWAFKAQSAASGGW